MANEYSRADLTFESSWLRRTGEEEKMRRDDNFNSYFSYYRFQPILDSISVPPVSSAHREWKSWGERRGRYIFVSLCAVKNIFYVSAGGVVLSVRRIIYCVNLPQRLPSSWLQSWRSRRNCDCSVKSRQERDEFQRNTGDKMGIMSDIKI